MPFTPFHFGPGLLLKSASPGYFSFIAFVATQVVIDCETLYHLLRQEYPLHRFFHSLAGGLVAGGVVAAMLLILVRLAPDSLEIQAPTFFRDLAPTAVVVGCGLGGISHSILDNILHTDVRPLYPLDALSGLHGIFAPQALHTGCIVSGVVGFAVLLFRSGTDPRDGSRQ